MNTLIAIVCFVFSLFGVDLGSRTIVDRIHVDGADTLYSKVVAQPGITRFECVHSASGQCYYTVYPRACSSTPVPASASTGLRARDCLSNPVERFALATGDSRRIPALPGSRLCVSAEARITESDCDAPEMIAAR